jgi:hypothetical protein
VLTTLLVCVCEESLDRSVHNIMLFAFQVYSNCSGELFLNFFEVGNYFTCQGGVLYCTRMDIGSEENRFFSSK